MEKISRAKGIIKKLLVLSICMLVLLSNYRSVLSEDGSDFSDNSIQETNGNTELENDENIEKDSDNEDNSDIEDGIDIPEDDNQEDTSNDSFELYNSAPLLGDGNTLGNNTQTGVFQMYWLSGSDEISINDPRNELVQRPLSDTSPSSSFSNTTNFVQVKIDFSTGGDKTVEEGDAEIRLPHHIFYNRNDEPVDRIYLSLVEDPELPSEDVSFNYYIDDMGTEDKGDDEIVIKNCYEITSARLFTMTLSWAYQPSKVKGGYQDDNDEWQNTYQKSFQARSSMKYIDHHDTEVVVEKETEVLSLEIHTGSRFTRNDKVLYKTFNYWQADWGEDPYADLDQEEKDKYFYAVWEGFWKVPTGNTQPFIIKLKDYPSTGEVVAYSGASSYITSNYGPSDYRFAPNTIKLLPDYDPESTIILMRGTQNTDGTFVYPEPNDNEHSRSSAKFVITRHPRVYDDDGNELEQEITNRMDFVLEGEDGCEQIVTRNSVLQYEGDPRNTYVYKGDEHSISKSWQTAYYYPVENLLHDKDCPSSTIIYIKGSSQSYDLTKDEDGNYGVHDYTFSLFDDFVTIHNPSNTNQRYILNKDDYYFRSVSVENVTHYRMDPYEGVETINTNYKDTDEYKPIDVYIKRASMGDDWILYGTYTQDDWTSSNSRTFSINFENLGITDVYAVRADDTTNAIKTFFEMSMGFTLKSTEHTKQISEEVGYGKSLTVNNYNSVAVRDYEGNYHDTHNVDAKDAYKNMIDGTALSNHDSEYDNKILKHARASNSLTGFPYESFTRKAVVSTTPTDRIIKIDGENPTVTFRMYADNSLRIGSYVGDEVEFMDEIINEYSNVVFYDLLTTGGYFIEDSVKVYALQQFMRSNSIWGPNGRRGEEISKDYYTVTLINNYKDSGRTLLKVEVNLPDDYHNFAQDGDTYGSGLAVDYTMGYTDYALHNIGPEVPNTFYLENKKEEFRNGANGNGGSTRDKEWYQTLDDQDQIDQRRAYRYSDTASANFRLEQAAELGYHKYVRAIDNSDPNWRTSTSVGASKEYEYLLMMNNLESSYATDVIIYEVLETGFKDQGATIVNHDHWNGEFISVNTENAKTYNDLNIKTYYSTKTSVELVSEEKEATFNPLDKPNQQLFIDDELNTEYWTLYPEGGLSEEEASKVTALAFDLREKTDGSQKIFDSGEKVQLTIKMRAPLDVKNYQDHLDEEPRDLTLVDEDGDKIAAWNQSVIYATIWNISLGNNPDNVPEQDKLTAIEASNRTEVFTYDFIEIEKHSDPITGTYEKPAILNPEQAIGLQEFRYYITLRNKTLEGTDPLRNVVVEDEIPSGLIVIEDEIEYSLHENNLENYQPIEGSTEISYTHDNNTYTFTLNEFAYNQELKIMIPVKVDIENADNILRYDNIARIKEFNDAEYEIDSNSTHHLRIPFEIEGIKKLDDENSNEIFTFILLDKEENILQEVNNNEDGSIKFETIYFEEYGTYEFTIKEATTQERPFIYDTREYKVTVEVIHDPHELTAVLKKTIKVNGTVAEEIVFENKTPEFPVIQLQASKTVNGSTPNDVFDFELKDDDEEIIEVIQNDRGKVLFSPLDINNEGTYIYYIKEVLGNKNYKYDEREYKVVIVISFNTDHYDVEVTYSTEDVEVEKVTFNNTRNDDKKEYKIPKTGVNEQYKNR